jgi:shikimate kinase
MNTNNVCKIISLVGPKHSGKSSVGKELALSLSANFLDLDFCIEEQSGKSPRTLYKEGADIFRKAEFDTLLAILESSAKNASLIVLAAGGGIVDNAEAAALLKEKSLVINLEVSAKTAWKRIAETSRVSGELPPFLQTSNPEETHRELHERRSKAYKELAAITVKADSLNIETIVSEIKNILTS